MCVSEICCHRRGASRDFERSRFTSRDHSGVPVAQRHWQSVESAAFRSWPFKIPSARVDQLHVSFFSSALFYRPPAGLQTATVSLRSSVGRGTLLRRAIRGNQLQSIDWVGSPWARRGPFL